MGPEGHLGAGLSNVCPYSSPLPTGEPCTSPERLPGRALTGGFAPSSPGVSIERGGSCRGFDLMSRHPPRDLMKARHTSREGPSGAMNDGVSKPSKLVPLSQPQSEGSPSPKERMAPSGTGGTAALPSHEPLLGSCPPVEPWALTIEPIGPGGSHLLCGVSAMSTDTGPPLRAAIGPPGAVRGHRSLSCSAWGNPLLMVDLPTKYWHQ